jgi:predicted RNase H-related nuclease YkuK (DUF458 family)
MIDFEELNEFVGKCGPNTKLYLGCDSGVISKYGKRMAIYTVAVVVHIDSRHGGKLFYKNVIEPDYSVSRNKPSPRLMMEVMKVADTYLKMLEKCENVLDKDIEIHLDINPEKEHKSSTIVKEAIGYIQGTCQVTPRIKPEAWCASTIADRFH